MNDTEHHKEPSPREFIYRIKFGLGIYLVGLVVYGVAYWQHLSTCMIYNGRWHVSGIIIGHGATVIVGAFQYWKFNRLRDDQYFVNYAAGLTQMTLVINIIWLNITCS